MNLLDIGETGVLKGKCGPFQNILSGPEKTLKFTSSSVEPENGLIIHCQFKMELEPEVKYK